jgi:hypothetical protein
MDHGGGPTLLLRGGPREGTQWEVHMDPLALLLSEVSAAVVPCVCRRVDQPFLLGASLLHVATRPGEKSSGRRQSLGIQVDADYLSVLADTHALQRSEVLREPEEEAFAAPGLCGE